MTESRTLLLVVGYFDWFSGYQEIGLAQALSNKVRVEVVTSNRVNPIFTDEHLRSLGIPREYPSGYSEVQGIAIHRFPVHEARAMVWSWKALSHVRHKNFDIIVQVAPGQALPIIGSFAHASERRTALYGDNSAMYANLSPTRARLKSVVFAATKGIAYRFVNRNALVFGYTPNTLQRLRRLCGVTSSRLLPLAYDRRHFYFDPKVRERGRRELGLTSNELLVVAPGKLRAQKRLDAAVEALAVIARQLERPVHLVFVGGNEGPVAEGLRRTVREHKLEERVTLLPFANKDDLNKWFNAADVGVWPVMPAVTIQQAMGTGLPVIVPNNDLVAHLVAPHISGWLYDPGADVAASLTEVIWHATREDHSSVLSVPRKQRAIYNEWLSTDYLADRLLQEDP